MKKNIKVIFKNSIIFILVILIFSLSGCGGNVRDSDTLKDIKGRAILRIGVYGDVPGFSELTDEGFVGFEAELAKIIGAYITEDAYPVELVLVSELSRTHALTGDKVDLCISQFTSAVTSSSYAASQPYFTDTYAFLVKSGSYSVVEDLAGKRVGAIYGQGVKSAVTNLSNKNNLGFEVADVPSYPEAADMLLHGRLDALCAQQSLLQRYAADGLELLPSGFGESSYYIVSHKNKKELITLADEKLKEMTENGRLDALKEKYGL